MSLITLSIVLFSRCRMVGREVAEQSNGTTQIDHVIVSLL